MIAFAKMCKTRNSFFEILYFQDADNGGVLGDRRH